MYQFLFNQFVPLIKGKEEPFFIHTKDIWNITFKLIDEIYIFSKKQNIPIVFVLIPERSQIINPRGSRYKNINVPPVDKMDFSQYTSTQILIEYFKENNYRWIDLTEYLKKISYRIGHTKSGHWSKRGHIIAATAIEDYIIREKLIR